MINISPSLYNRLDRLIEKYKGIEEVMKDFAKKITTQISLDMTREIETHRYIWAEPNTKLAALPEITFDIQYTGNNSVRVEVGSTIPNFEMSDGSKVSPIYFIEYGFGIVGENNPASNADRANWEYNINNHTDYWYFKGLDGRTEKSKGIPGINFMYNTMRYYSAHWEEEFRRFIKENT